MFFRALTFAPSRGSFLTMKPIGRVFKHRQRAAASVNAMKQTCVIVILAYLTYSNPIRTENAAKTLHCPFFTLNFSKQNGVGCVLSYAHNVVTTS